jgi:DNA polymerase I-like protein with 3'-5' exonuclease and polymerase domains
VRYPKIKALPTEYIWEMLREDRPQRVAIDIEGGGGKPVLLGLSWRRMESVVCWWEDTTREMLNWLFNQTSILPIFHNANFDVKELVEAGCVMPENWIDTIVLAAHLDANLPLRLESQVLGWVPGSVAWKGMIGFGEPSNDDLADRRVREIWSRMTDGEVGTGWDWKDYFVFYNGLDVGWTLELYESYKRLLSKSEFAAYAGIDFPIQPVLIEMGMRGLRLDEERLRWHRTACLRLERMAARKLEKVGGELTAGRRRELEEEIARHEAERERERGEGGRRKYSQAKLLTALRGKLKGIGEGFNVDSPKQRVLLLVDKLGVKLTVPRGKKQPTTDEEFIDKLITKIKVGKIKTRIGREESLEILQSIVAGKKWATWRRGFLREGLGERLLTDYSLHRTATGRIASGVDNSDMEKGKGGKKKVQLQNVPKILRDIVIPDEGKIFIGADYAAIEWCIAMYFASLLPYSKGFHLELLEKFQLGKGHPGFLDPHRYLAAKRYGVGMEEVSDRQRTEAKTWTFALLYGADPVNIGEKEGIGKKESLEMGRAHEEAFRLQEWIRWESELAAKTHQVVCAGGRTRRFLELVTRNKYGRLLTPKPTETSNTKVQGSAAELMKAAMGRGRERKPEWVEWMTTTHDFLMVQVPEEKEEEGRRWMKEVMEFECGFLGGRKWRSDVKSGRSWRAVT